MKKAINLYIYLSLSLSLIMTGVLGCSLDKERNLGNGYFLTGYGATTVIYKNISKKEDKEILMGEIVEYTYNNNFILIYRKVSKEVIEFFNDHYISEIMRGGDSIQYWIIDKKKDTIIGPLNKDDYLLKCQELNVSNNIQLEIILKNKSQ